jgi:predicted nuclease of predicted toxin-antitoxin system
MRFRVDENLPIEVAAMRQQAGYDAATVPEQHLGGSDDAQLAALCQLEGRILVTLDMDFSGIRNYQSAEFPSLVVLRLRQQDKPHVLDVFMRCMQVLDQEPIEGHLWIVEERRIRIRGEPG